MGDFLKKYNIELKTVGPVFIGSGETINKKEALFKKDKVVIIDTKLMFEYFLKRNLLKQYQEYMLDTSKDLAVFFKDNNIDEKIYKTWNIKELSLGDTKSTGDGDVKGRGIVRFVRDGNGRVYVPGSSLKGMLRTILAGAYIIGDRDKRKYASNDLDIGAKRFKILEAEIKDKAELKTFKTDKEKESWIERRKRNGLEETFKVSIDNIELQLFHKQIFSSPDEKIKLANKINDSLRGFMVSDSEYISDEDMCVCQKVDVSLDGTEILIPLYRECIKPGVTIRFSITIDSSFCDYTKPDIIESIGSFYENYWNKVSKQFKKAPISKDRYTCFLGGGAGFESKTIIYSSFERTKAVDFTSNILSVMFPNAKHDKDMEVSPRVINCTKFEHTKHLFGACSLRKFEEEPIDLS